MGHFAKGNLKTNELEVNWGIQKKGDKKDSIGTNLKAKTLVILIKGKMVQRFPNDKKEVILTKQGDFVFWENGIAHTWEALEDSVSIVVRWPSLPEDQITE